MSNPGPAGAILANSQIVLDGLRLLFFLPGANMQINTDQIFTKMFQGLSWDPQFITACWASGAFSASCLGGIYPLSNKGGTGIVSSTQSYAGLTGGANSHVNCQIQATTTTNTTVPFLSLTTPNGAAMTADFRIYGFCYD